MEDRRETLPEQTRSSYERVLGQDLFFFLLDLEVKRARRYQSFVCLLFLKLKELSHHPHQDSIETFFQILVDLLTVEMRETDILGLLSDHGLAALLPYADDSAGGAAQSRFQNTLKYFNFEEKGYEVTINHICFPMNGTDAGEMIRKALCAGG
jgi:hypothetical protein